MTDVAVNGDGLRAAEATSLTLFVDVEPGTRIDLEVFAEAAIRWSRLIRAASTFNIFQDEVSVELEGAFIGSHRLVAIIRTSGPSREAVKGAIITALLFVGTEPVGWGVSQVLNWMVGADAPAQVHELSDEARQSLAEEVVVALQREVGRREAREVYEALERDPRVTGVGVTAAGNQRPEVVISRSEFPSEEDEPDQAPDQRVTTQVAELLLIRPVLLDRTDRQWQFETALGTFGAPIKDTGFLDRVANGTLGVPLTQGIRLRVDLEVTEEFRSGVWHVTDRSVLRVLEVIPPVEQSLLGFVGTLRRRSPPTTTTAARAKASSQLTSSAALRTVNTSADATAGPTQPGHPVLCFRSSGKLTLRPVALRPQHIGTGGGTPQ